MGLAIVASDLGQLGEVLEHVSFLVADTALDLRSGTEDVADRFAERFGSINDEEDPLLGVKATLDQVAEQGGRHGRVLGRALP